MVKLFDLYHLQGLWFCIWLMPVRNFSGPRCTRLIASFLIRLPKSCIRLVSNQKLDYLLLRQFLSLALTLNALNNLKFSAIWTFFDRQLFKKYICKFCPVALVSWNPTIFKWYAGLLGWWNDRLIDQVLFYFIISCKIICKNLHF